MTTKTDKSAADIASRDPFNQPEFKIAKADSRAMEQEILKSLRTGGETCGTLAQDDNKNDTAAASGSGDPFAQLVGEIARHTPGSQLTLDYNFADKPPPDRGYDSIVRQMKEVRG